MLQCGTFSSTISILIDGISLAQNRNISPHHAVCTRNDPPPPPPPPRPRPIVYTQIRGHVGKHKWNTRI
jgi:hypothetical protein